MEMTRGFIKNLLIQALSKYFTIVIDFEAVDDLKPYRHELLKIYLTDEKKPSNPSDSSILSGRDLSMEVELFKDIMEIITTFEFRLSNFDILDLKNLNGIKNMKEKKLSLEIEMDIDGSHPKLIIRSDLYVSISAIDLDLCENYALDLFNIKNNLLDILKEIRKIEAQKKGSV